MPVVTACVRAWVATIVVASLVAIVRDAAPACDRCTGRLPARTGSFVLILRAAPARVRRGQPVRVRLAIENRGDRGLPVDLGSPVSQIRFNVLGPRAGRISLDPPSPGPVDAVIPPGATRSFPVRSLRQWGYADETPGSYAMNASYDGVDSNVVRFVVEP